MFNIILTIVCAVFVIGYIFFSAASEQDTGARSEGRDFNIFSQEKDAA